MDRVPTWLAYHHLVCPPASYAGWIGDSCQPGGSTTAKCIVLVDDAVA